MLPKHKRLHINLDMTGEEVLSGLFDKTKRTVGPLFRKSRGKRRQERGFQGWRPQIRTGGKRVGGLSPACTR